MTRLRAHAIHCTCGAQEPVELPTTLRELLLQLRDFLLEHETCRKETRP